ncbi:hypothetical protein [Sphingomonas sp. MMS24-J13]|uniref:hypothetical protein n=1 Tax=Sphingomonas sp. MMS24-J13 TaxID=3238686 RepID=UPI00384FDBC2
MTVIASGQAVHVVLFPMMRGEMTVEAQHLTELGNQARNADGMPDASKLSAADWARVWRSADRLSRAASDLASPAQIDVVGSQARIETDGSAWASPANEIKRYIDRDRGGFADRARDLGHIAEQFKRAANTHDAGLLGESAARLDEVCEACHLRFWYPDPKPVE